jgi:uncharacterized protein YeaO (DUF488 family)
MVFAPAGSKGWWGWFRADEFGSAGGLIVVKVKHFLEDSEPDDGQRVWVESIGLTLDLREWCKVDHVLSHLGPPLQLWKWFESHPNAWEYFRGRYHEALSKGPYRETLRDLATAARSQNFTLLHQGDDPGHNTAVALHEFLQELEAYAPPEQWPVIRDLKSQIWTFCDEDHGGRGMNSRGRRVRLSSPRGHLAATKRIVRIAPALFLK